MTHSSVIGVREILVDKAADVRAGASVTPETAAQVENWRLVATTKLQSKR